MSQQDKYDKAKYAIKLCMMICAFIIGGALMFYFCRMHSICNESWQTWYNFLSPYIAIANIIAFIGLTVAIYLGESTRQTKHEQVNIQNTIIAKLQRVENDLAVAEKTLRSDNVGLQDVYTTYIILYRHTHYFNLLPDLSILSQREQERKIAKDVLKRIEATRDVFIKFYNDHKTEDKFLFTHEMKHDLAYHINYLTAHLEEFEISIIQDISITIEEPK